MESRIVLHEAFVHIFEGRRGRRGCAHGEAEAVGLIVVMVGVLAKDYDLDGVERCVLRPAKSVSINALSRGSGWREHGP